MTISAVHVCVFVVTAVNLRLRPGLFFNFCDLLALERPARSIAVSDSLKITEIDTALSWRRRVDGV